MSEIDNRIAALQADIRSQREALDRIKPDARGYQAAFERVLKATNALVAYEKEIPAIVAEPHRRRSKQIVTWLIRAFTGVILVLGLLAVLGVTSRWWLLLLVPLAGVGSWLWLHPVDVVIADHVAQRRGALLLAVVAVLAVVLVIGLSAALTFLGIVAIGACIAWSLPLLHGDDTLERK